MALRVITYADIRPPIALDPNGQRYFSERIGDSLSDATSKISRNLERRVRTRIETETFGVRSKFGGHKDHTGNTVKAFQVTSGGGRHQTQTPVKGLRKAEGFKVLLTNQNMPWPLITDYPIGVPTSRKAGYFIIRPRADRRPTGKSRKKRLVFFWKNAGKKFIGKKVRHPGFGPDVLSQEMAAAREAAITGARAAVARSVLEWTVGGSKAQPSKLKVRR